MLSRFDSPGGNNESTSSPVGVRTEIWHSATRLARSWTSRRPAPTRTTLVRVERITPLRSSSSRVTSGWGVGVTAAGVLPAGGVPTGGVGVAGATAASAATGSIRPPLIPWTGAAVDRIAATICAGVSDGFS